MIPWRRGGLGGGNKEQNETGGVSSYGGRPKRGEKTGKRDDNGRVRKEGTD